MNKLWILIPHYKDRGDESFNNCIRSIKGALLYAPYKYEIVIGTPLNIQIEGTTVIYATDRFELASNILDRIEEDDVVTFIDDDDCVTLDYFFEPLKDNLQYSDAMRHIPIIVDGIQFPLLMETPNRFSNCSNIAEYINCINSGTFGTQIWGWFYPKRLFDKIFDRFMAETEESNRKAALEDSIWCACVSVEVPTNEIIEKRSGIYVWNRYAFEKDEEENIIFKNNISMSNNILKDGKFMDNILLARKISRLEFAEETKQANILFQHSLYKGLDLFTGIKEGNKEQMKKFCDEILPIIATYRFNVDPNVTEETGTYIQNVKDYENNGLNYRLLMDSDGDLDENAKLIYPWLKDILI